MTLKALSQLAFQLAPIILPALPYYLLKGAWKLDVIVMVASQK
jgi:hypothetical protein